MCYSTKLNIRSISVLSFDRFRIREALVSSHPRVTYFVFPPQGQPTAKITAAVKTRRERFPSPASIAAEHLLLTFVEFRRTKNSFNRLSNSLVSSLLVTVSRPGPISSLRRRPRLHRPCLPAVTRFHFALDIRLDRLVVAGTDGRSCPEAPDAL